MLDKTVIPDLSQEVIRPKNGWCILKKKVMVRDKSVECSGIKGMDLNGCQKEYIGMWEWMSKRRKGMITSIGMYKKERGVGILPLLTPKP